MAEVGILSKGKSSKFRIFTSPLSFLVDQQHPKKLLFFECLSLKIR
jgi:hypothetical protein